MKNQFAFSLIELLMVLAIVSIVGAFCLPIYSQFIQKIEREEAIIQLAKLALVLEHYAQHHQTYTGATLANLNWQDKTLHYQLSILKLTDSEFTLAAYPKKTPLSCGTLMLTSKGEKRFSGTGTLKECWT